MRRNEIYRTVVAAVSLALCYVLPFLTGQIPEIGAMLCPMHIPVLLCGYIAGRRWGLAVGFCAPLLRALTLGMPPLFPTAICMALELAVYGYVSGLLHRIFPTRGAYIYLSLVISMILGRLFWGAAMFLLLFASGGKFTFAAFIAGALTGALPGIVIQIVLVPPLVLILERSALKRYVL